MIGFRTYKGVLAEIDILVLRESVLIRRLRDLEKQLGGPEEVKALDYAWEPGDAYEPSPLADAMVQYLQTKDMLLRVKRELARLRWFKLKVDEKLQGLDDLDYKVAYLRDVKNKTLAEIANELGYSEIWIKKISAKIQ